MDSYLVSKLDETTVGGLGHLFDDIVTSYIITEIFDFRTLAFSFSELSVPSFYRLGTVF